MHANSIIQVAEPKKMDIYTEDQFPRMTMIAVSGIRGHIGILEAFFDFIENLKFAQSIYGGMSEGGEIIESEHFIHYITKKDKKPESYKLIQDYVKNFLQMRITMSTQTSQKFTELTEPFGSVPKEVLEGDIDRIEIRIGNHSIEFYYGFTYNGVSYSSPRLVAMRSIFGHGAVFPVSNMYLETRKD